MLEVVIVSIVGIRKVLEPLLGAPHHGPRLAFGGWCHDVIVLGMYILMEKEGFETGKGLLIVTELVDMRATREVGIHHNLVGIVAKPQGIEIPEIIVGFVIEIQAVQAFYPTHLHLDIEGGLVDALVLATIVPHLFDGHHIAIGHHIPIGKGTVDAWNLILRELENLETGFGYLYIGSLCEGTSRQESAQQHTS